MKEILQIACGRLREGGSIVANAATLESLQSICNELKANGFSPDVTLLNIARQQGHLRPYQAGTAESDICRELIQRRSKEGKTWTAII